MYAYLKYKHDKEYEIKKLQDQIDELQVELDLVKNKSNTINLKWWWYHRCSKQIPTILLNYNSIANVCDYEFINIDNTQSGCDYWILLCAGENHSDDIETIFDIEIADIDISSSYSSFTSKLGIWLCGGGRCAFIQIKLSNNTLYYKYSNVNYIEFPDDFPKEILEILCPK
jgi:hypothetical protein